MLRKKLLNSTEQCDNNKKQKTIETPSICVVNKNLFQATSKYFNPLPAAEKIINPIPIWQQLYQIELKLNAIINLLKFKSPVAAVYNPIDYSAELHCAYLRKFLNIPLSVLFIGMNPGPWGMCQTGVITGLYNICMLSTKKKSSKEIELKNHQNCLLKP